MMREVAGTIAFSIFELMDAAIRRQGLEKTLDDVRGVLSIVGTCDGPGCGRHEHWKMQGAWEGALANAAEIANAIARNKKQQGTFEEGGF